MMTKRLLCALLALCLALSLAPADTVSPVFAAEYGAWSGWSTTKPGEQPGRQIETRSTVVGYNMVTYLTMGQDSVRQYRSYSVNGNYAAYGLRSAYGEFHYTYYADATAIANADICAEGAYVNYAGNTAGYNMGHGTAYCGWAVQDCLVWFIESENAVKEYRYRDELIKTYEVVFKDWNGTTMSAQTVAEGKDATPPEVPSRAGYTFTGWNTAADGSGTAYAGIANVTLKADLTLYAQWARDTDVYALLYSDGELVFQAGSKTDGRALLGDTEPWNITELEAGGNANAIPWNDYSNNIITVTVKTVFAPKHLDFSYLPNLSEISGVGNLDTSNVTSFHKFFVGCSSIKKLDLSGWDASNVTDMYRMFDGCSSLAELDLSGWDTSKVTDMSYMFEGCSSLLKLDLGGWDTSEVEDMSGMFSDCSSLAELNMSGWDTSKVTNMDSMFDSCSSLSELDLAGWNTSKVEYMDSMFAGCWHLKTIYAGSGFTFGDNSFSWMFSGCTALVGGAGTVYDETHIDSVYARVDSASAPGYFTAKGLPTPGVTYTVTFYSNDGTGAAATQTVTENTLTALNANTFTRFGYVFRNWNTEATGGGTSYEDQAEIITGANLTLYAQWTQNAPATYTVSFNANGGSGSMPAQTVTANTSTPLNANSFTRSGYTFSGWNTAANGSGTAYADRASVTLNANLALYAQWTQNAPASYTISFNASGGDGAMAAQTVAVGSSAALNANRFTRDSYTFGGWATQAGGRKAYADRGTVTPSADMELYAVWQPITYVVLYNANGGENAPPSDIKAHGSDLELSDEEPAREGYTFQGWSVKRDGEVKYQPGGVYSANANATLYAVWTRNNNSRIPSMAEDVSYGFGNTLNDFSYDRNIEAIPKRVFQLVFGVTQRAEEYFNRNKVWNGNCFGMTATAGILFADGDDYAPAAFSEGKARANQLSLSDQYKMGFLSLQEFIEALQVVQYSEIVQIDLAKNSFTTAYYTKPLNDLVAAVQYFEKTGNDPPVVAVYSAKGKGHALLGYKVDFENDKSARLWVYDPNYPNNNTRYIKLNRSGGEYTGWEYGISSKETWGSINKEQSRISFIPYKDIYDAWQHRGAGLGSAGAVISVDKDLIIKDVDGDGPPLASISGGGVSSNSPDIFQMDYLGVVLDENENIIDTDDGTVSLWLPADRYQVQWAGTPKNLLGAAPEDGLNLTLTHTDQSASVTTGASTIIIDVDDSQQLNYVRFAAADAGRSYDVTLNSTLDKTTEKVRLTGTVEEDGTALSQRKGNIGVSGADAATLYINTVKQDAGMGYAFSDVPCLVTVSAGGGSGTMPAIAVEADRNEKLVMPDCTLEAPLGFTFDCWKLDQNGALYQPGDSVELLGDAVITALWKATNDKYAVQSAETDGAAVTALVQNIRGTGGTALVSAYDGEGRLLDVAECKLPALKEGDAGDIRVELPHEGAAEVKIFICDNNLRPLCPAFTLELDES